MLVALSNYIQNDHNEILKCKSSVSLVPDQLKKFHQTVDGCEILHQLVDDLPVCPIIDRVSTILLVVNVATVHHSSVLP